jgi:hypothetical protein
MKCFDIDVIHQAIPSRKEGYIEEIKKRNKSNNEEQYCLEQEDILYIRQTYRKEHALPSIGQMIRTAAQAAIDETKAITRGESPVSQEEINRRLSICGECEFFTPNIKELSEKQRKQRRCVKCGCFMNLKAKLRSNHCPIGKW